MNPEPTPTLAPMPEQPQATVQAPVLEAAPEVTPAPTVETTIVDQSATVPAVSTVEVPMIAEEDKITPPVMTPSAPTLPQASPAPAPAPTTVEGNWSQKGVVLTPNEQQAMTEGKLNQ